MVVTFYGFGAVWDAEKGRQLCEFSSGEYTSDDPRVIEIMRKNGFKEKVLEEDSPVIESPIVETSASEDPIIETPPRLQ